jgi:hypothetical protein
MTKIFSAAGRQLIHHGWHSVYADAEIVLPAIDIHKESKKSGSLVLASDGRMAFPSMNLPSNLMRMINLPRSPMDQMNPFDDVGDTINGPRLGDNDDGSDGSVGSESHQVPGQQVGPAETPNSGNIPLDFPQWLPFCAPKYKISPDIKDYVIIPVIAIPSDLPNRNRIAFPLKELLAFNPELGMQAYRTWVGKPTFSEHKNDVIEEAYGVIADTSMVKLNGWAGGRIWKLLMLAAFDRSKYVERVSAIAQGDVNSYSMGAWVSGYQCSVCNAEVGKCMHVDMKDTRASLTSVNDRLAFKNCSGILGFELSVVDNPAWVTAISDKVADLR